VAVVKPIHRQLRDVSSKPMEPYMDTGTKAFGYTFSRLAAYSATNWFSMSMKIYRLEEGINKA
jgi:hypothetical protein